MDATLNITLLVVGFAGALVAFAGDTLNKEASTWRGRITRVGWTSIALLSIALALGVIKEFRTRRDANRQSRRAIQAEGARQKAEQQLASLASELRVARTQLSGLRRDLPLESDSGYTDLDRRRELVPRSARTGEPLALYGGDEFEYHVFCAYRGLLTPSRKSGVYLAAGDRLYPLDDRSGTVRIAGRTGMPIEVFLLNTRRESCGIKFHVRSTIRNRGGADRIPGIDE